MAAVVGNPAYYMNGQYHDVLTNDEIGKLAQEDVEETVSDEVFASYTHKDILPGCRPHPGDIVEAGSLAALSPPDAVYPLMDSFPSSTVTEGKLSSLQLEGIMYACQRHQVVLATGNRAGFFIGDAAGVGKGRQISGIILDNYARGRTKHLWFSVSTDLVVDARRDLNDIGCFIKVIDGCQQLDKETRVLGLPSDFKEGVVFSTYSTLVSTVQRGSGLSAGKQSRLQQLIDWCGGANFDGCLIFDECHKAKNFVPGKEQASTKVALAVTNLQRMLPKSRVLYCSATGVTDVKNMAFMERLGLWGEGATFRNFDQFIETVQRKGLGVAEMLAMEMKSSGMYVCRSLSFKEAEFVTVEVELTKDQRKMYNLAAHVWSELKRSLEAAINRTNTNNSRIWAQYWGAHQRFFRQLCLGVKVGAIVQQAQEALEAGYCVVIGLQTTGEASMESELQKNASPLKSWVSLCREILTRFIQLHFPTSVEKQPGSHGPPEDDWSVTAKQMLLGFAEQIKLPDSPLDELIDRLGGPSQVAEMTGRRGRIIRSTPSDHPHYEMRDSDSNGNLENLNVRERNEFMAGRKLVAIISDAASTGISLHADERVANQRRRVHMTMELPWSADKAVQQLGRSHRSNQSSGPLYRLITTSLGGERRFAAAVAKRLQALGALTKGDRRAATGADLTEFNFDTPYGRAALRSMYSAICQKTIPVGIPASFILSTKKDITQFNEDMMLCLSQMGILESDVITDRVKVKDADARDVSKFLNRILGLAVEKQNLIFDYFMKCLDAQVGMAKKEGRYSEGLVDVTASSIQLVGSPRLVFTSKASNNATRHVVVKVDRGMSWERAVQRLEHNPGPGCGFYRSKRPVYGHHLFLLATLKPGSKHMYRIARPNTGVSYLEEEKTDLLQKYTAMSIEDAEAGWLKQYDDSKERCMHGSHCRAPKGSCSVGSRCYFMHLLCGGIVTMMSILEQTIVMHGPKLNLTKAESTLRVVRVQLDSGERLVGIRYPELLIPLAEEALLQESKMRAFLKDSAKGSAPSPETPAPVAHQGDTDAQKSSTEEPVSEVVPRCLQKAITPPVTIKNFFKPSMTDASASSSNDSSSCNSVPKPVLKTVSSLSAQSDSKNTHNGIHKSVTGLSSPSIQSPAVKRPASSVTSMPSAKKPRQTSIMSMFAKQKSSESKPETKEIKCPICDMKFDKGTSNATVNQHVDSCLIE